MDMNDVDGSLHEIEQMVLVPSTPMTTLRAATPPPGFSKCRRKIPSYLPSASMTS
jgi:hypothetical protein